MTLERIWAGWRSAYVSGVAQVEPVPGECVFCGVFAADATDRERLIVHRGDTCVAMLNLYPVRVGPLARHADTSHRRPTRLERRRAGRVVRRSSSMRRSPTDGLRSRRHERGRQSRTRRGRGRARPPAPARAAAMGRRHELHDGDRRDARDARGSRDHLRQGDGGVAR